MNQTIFDMNRLNAIAFRILNTMCVKATWALDGEIHKISS